MASQLKTIQELTAENATLKTRIRELEAAAAESNWTLYFTSGRSSCFQPSST